MCIRDRDSIDQLVPAVYTGFRNSNYSSWVVTDVFVLTYPQHPTESVIQVKQGNLRFALYFSQEGGLLHERDTVSYTHLNYCVIGKRFILLKYRLIVSFGREKWYTSLSIAVLRSALK